MFSFVLGNLFMILASQAQKDATKLVQTTAQTPVSAAQIDPQAFDLLLAFMNTSSDNLPLGPENLTRDLSVRNHDGEAENDPLADQFAIAAKIADWFQSNPASLAVLGGLTSIAPATATAVLGGLTPIAPTTAVSGLSESLLGALGQRDFNPQDVQALLAKLIGSAQTAPLDGAEQGAALVAAIEQAGDSHSLAAALMGAVASGIGKVPGRDTSLSSSNLLLTEGRRGDHLLADALGLLSLGLNGSSGGSASVAFTKQIGTDRGASEVQRLPMGANLGREQQASSLDPYDLARLSAEGLGAEMKQHQLELSDALLSPTQIGSPLGFDALQQAMSAQSLGKASIVNTNSLESTVSWLASQQGGSATIDLTPPELGSLRLELKIDAGGESAVLIVHAANETAKAAIEQSLDRLYESFQNSGMSLQVSVGSGSSQFSGMFSNGFDERSKPRQLSNRVLELGRPSIGQTSSNMGSVASDALSLYA
jgi:flagellar hook-length control protein FliK